MIASITEEEFLEAVKCKLSEKSTIQGPIGCKVWQGGSDGRYGEVKMLAPVHPPARKVFRVHRLAMMVKLNTFALSGGHVSHLCHNKYCINEDHLSLEPQYVNNQREFCRSNIKDGKRSCSHHNPFPDCIL